MTKRTFRYDGDLTISIDPGLDVTIPNHQLVVPEYYIDSDGQTYIKNNSNREVLINSLQEINGNDGLVLGLPFFTSAYMMVDHDREQFTLWQSRATTMQDIVPASAFNCSNSSTTTTTPSSLPSASSNSSESSTPAQPSSVSKGIIAGAVVGGLAGLALLLLGLYFLLKRNRTQAQKNTDIKDAKRSSRPTSLILYKPELPSDSHPPQEMALVPDPGFSIAPYEIMADRSHQEMPAKEPAAATYEMPAATPRGREFELPGLPSSPRNIRRK